MSASPPEHARRLEVRCRRPVAPGVPHPDLCPKLTLGGAAFAIPPRGARVAPSFDAGRVGAGVTGLDDWPEARRLPHLATVHEEDRCETCGRPRRATLEADTNRGVEFLAAAFELACRLLDRQYELTDAQKAELLAFDTGELPAWIVQLLRWCGGMPAGEGA